MHPALSHLGSCTACSSLVPGSSDVLVSVCTSIRALVTQDRTEEQKRVGGAGCLQSPALSSEGAPGWSAPSSANCAPGCAPGWERRPTGPPGHWAVASCCSDKASVITRKWSVVTTGPGSRPLPHPARQIGGFSNPPGEEGWGWGRGAPLPLQLWGQRVGLGHGAPALFSSPVKHSVDPSALIGGSVASGDGEEVAPWLVTHGAPPVCPPPRAA